jgi:hypothetical protein
LPIALSRRLPFTSFLASSSSSSTEKVGGMIFYFFTTFQRAVEKQLDSIPWRLVKGEIWDFLFLFSFEFSLLFFFWENLLD